MGEEKIGRAGVAPGFPLRFAGVLLLKGIYFVPLIGASAAHTKFWASSALPLPFHFATFGNTHSGRVRSTLPSVRCDATMRSGALPVVTHASSIAALSNVSVPGPPWQ